MFGLRFLTVSYIHLPTLRIPATSPCQRWGCCSTARTVKPLPCASRAFRLLPRGKKPPELREDPPAPSFPKDAGVSPAEARKLSPPGKVWAGGRHLARPCPGELGGGGQGWPWPALPSWPVKREQGDGSAGEPLCPPAPGVGEDPAKTARGRPHCSGAPRFSLFARCCDGTVSGISFVRSDWGRISTIKIINN